MVTHYNENELPVKFERYTSGVVDIIEKTKYDTHHNILEELRIEKSGADMDTVLFQYHYNYLNDGDEYIAFRTNNTDTVTKYTIRKDNNKIHKTEKIYPSGEYV